MYELNQVERQILERAELPSAQLMREKTDKAEAEYLRNRTHWVKEQLMRAKATPNHPRRLSISEPYLPPALVIHLSELGYNVESTSLGDKMLSMTVSW